MVRQPRRPSPQKWTTFLRNHLDEMVSVDFLTVPTISFRVLYVFVVLSHLRRKILHFNVTATPSARWTAQQLREAFPFASPPRYLLRDRDGIYGLDFQHVAQALDLEEVRIAPRSPSQSPYVERFIGSLRRECLDYLIVLNRAHLYRVLESYFSYYYGWRTHLALDKDAPEPRRVQPAAGRQDCCLPRSRRTASSLPTPGCLKLLPPRTRQRAFGQKRRRRRASTRTAFARSRGLPPVTRPTYAMRPSQSFISDPTPLSNVHRNQVTSPALAAQWLFCQQQGNQNEQASEK